MTTPLQAKVTGVGRTIDMHMHSTASDGAAEPAAVVAAAVAAGISVIALTDHDTVAGVADARAAGQRAGLEVVAGVELSAFENDRETHILGLHLSRFDALERRLEHLQNARRERAVRIVEVLGTLGVNIGMNAVLAEARGGAIGRPHIARALIAAGAARDSRDAFDRYLGFGRPAFVPKETLPIADAIELIHEAGGIAVLAHPGGGGVREWVEPLVAMGMDGLEVRHPGHSAEDMRRIAALADHFGLVPSGGSDWHGAAQGSRVIGCMHVPAEWLDLQLERVERVAASRVS